MADAALRQLDRDLPRIDMRSKALAGRQQQRLLPARPPQSTHLEGQRAAALAMIEDARALADAIVAEAHRKAEAILQEAARLKPARLRLVADIIAEEARRFGFRPQHLTGRLKTLPVVAARRAAMVAVFRERPDLSLAAIGRQFGGRDRTTVMHALTVAGVRRAGGEP